MRALLTGFVEAGPVGTLLTLLWVLIFSLLCWYVFRPARRGLYLRLSELPLSDEGEKR